jgi:hypothetical protein
MELLEFLAFEKRELNEFFQQFSTMFITRKPDAFDPFSKYFIQVIDHFAADIQSPLPRWGRSNPSIAASSSYRP